MNPKLRFALWVGGIGGRLCAWSYSVEQRLDDREPCPDCHAKDCYCTERAAEQDMFADIDTAAYFEGRRDGYDAAREEFA